MDNSLVGWLRFRAETSPTHIPLRLTDGRSITYGEWWRRSCAAARGIRDRAPSRSRIALVFGEDQWIDYATAYIAVLASGNIAVPISNTAGRYSIAEALRETEVDAVVSLPQLNIAAPSWALADLEEQAGSEDGSPAKDPSEIAEILRTSGTSGRQKNVLVPYGSLIAGLTLDAEPAQFTGPSGHSINSMPIGSSAGQKAIAYAIASVESTPIFLARFDPATFSAAVEKYAATKVGLAPTMLLALDRARSVGPFTTVGRLTLSAAQSGPHLVKTATHLFPNAEIYDFYGATESGGARLIRKLTLDDPDPGFWALPPTEARIVDIGWNDVPAGEEGLLALKTQGPPRRYADGDGERTFSGDWTRTGDLAIALNDGSIQLKGRSGDTIITGGVNVAPSEVVRALNTISGIAECEVVGIPDQVLGQVVAAAIVPAEGAGLSVDAVRREAQRLVGTRKAPRRIRIVDELPRVLNNKVDRRAVAALFEPTPTVPPAQYRAIPADLLRLVRLAVWEVLEGRPGDNEDLFELGLDSLNAVEIATMLEARLSINVDPMICFEYPSIESISRRLAVE